MSESIELSIVMPCLNEAETLERCIVEAQAGLAKARCVGEIIVADNGSTDGSREIARKLGAIVIEVATKGYGSALRAGTLGARGRWIIMGDSDLSYDLADLGPFLEKLREGYDLVMGCRMPGGGGRIIPHAMPLLNRYIGNPALTFIGRIFFRIEIHDFHCGIRGYSKEAFESMELTTLGMEFATEMVVKAALKKMRITEVPVTLRKDGRSRPPHLRRWRDGWRHLRFMLIFSPKWLFLYPGLALTACGLALFLPLSFDTLRLPHVRLESGTLAIAGMSIVVGFQVLAFALLGGAHSVARGTLPKSQTLSRLLQLVSLERGIFLGGAFVLLGVALLMRSVLVWRQVDYGELNPAAILRIIIPGATAVSVGIQMIFTSFFLSLLDLKTEE